jgi:alpha-galactosidase
MTVTAMRSPDAVFIQADPGGPFERAVDRGGRWQAAAAVLEYSASGDARLVSASAVSRLALRWATGVPERARVFLDAWERTYGDSGWTGPQPHRALPWFWLAHDESAGTTTGAGVATGPGAWASWTVDVDGMTLWLDVRSGQRALEPGDRQVDLATVLWLESGDTPFAAHAELTAAMAPPVPVPVGPVVGSNNWYYAYGHGFDADAVVQDARTIVELAGGHPVRPFAVIDAGWGEGTGSADGGPFERGKESFRDMSGVADRIRNEGARPGLWYRPLLTREPSPLAHDVPLDLGFPLDPSLPGTLEQVRDDLVRFRGWGYELVKHDFSTFDVTGAFAPSFGARMGSGAFTFADRTRTTAEILRDFYRVVADAAGDAVVLGCNTVGHLAAGLVAVNRIGDDTSGRQWERTRRMGVNTLAMRLAQHGRFFTADADCVPATPATPWELNRQFLELVAASGTALFLSLDPASLSREVRRDVAEALTVALDGGVDGGVEPLDQLYSTTPRRWRVGDEERVFDWSDRMGAEPFVHGVA